MTRRPGPHPIVVVVLLVSFWRMDALAAGLDRRLGIDDFFRPDAIEGIRLNPAGDLFIASVTDRFITSIRVQEVSGDRSADITRFAISEAPEIRLLRWVGNRTILVSLRGQPKNHVVRVVLGEDELRLEMTEIVRNGMVIDSLQESEDEILFSPYSDPRDVYRVDVDLLTDAYAGRNSPFSAERRVTRMKAPVTSWRVDRSGAPRIASTEDSRGRIRFWFADPITGRWSSESGCWRLGEDWILPLGPSADGRTILVAAHSNRGRVGIYTCSPTGDTPLVPVFEHALRDVQGVIRSREHGEIEAVYYFEGGRTRIHHLDPEKRERWRSIEARFPGQAVWPRDESASGGLVVWVGSSSDPGRIILLKNDRLTELGRVAPWLDGHEMGRVRNFEIDVPGVGPIESTLTLPRDDGLRPPLIVYPHGGPVGVADEPGFDDAVQYLASAGYAVLQVNYRGSSGLGRDFEEAGWREWGRGIEDDIDAAVEKVLSEGIVDRARICIVGESYGGYSALISTVRHPDRYRCAASTAGVTDIALLLDTADYGRTQQGREMFAKMIGDLDADHDEMNRHSPVYRVEEMRTPILIIHGEEDIRVDPEHAQRFAMMLALHGKEHELVMLPGLGHGGWTRREVQWYFHRLRQFLDFHLS